MDKTTPAFDNTITAYQMARVLCPSCGCETGWVERAWSERQVCACGQVLLSSVEQEAIRKVGAEGAKRYMAILRELGMIRDSWRVTSGGMEGLMNVAALVAAESHAERVAIIIKGRAVIELEHAISERKAHASKEAEWRQRAREEVAKNGANCTLCHRRISPSGGYLYAAKTLGRGIDTVTSSRGAWLLCSSCAFRLTPFGCLYASQDENIESEVHPGDVIDGTARWRRALFSNMARLCKQKGLAPWQARRKARQLAEAFWKEPYDARTAAMEFWGV